MIILVLGLALLAVTLWAPVVVLRRHRQLWPDRAPAGPPSDAVQATVSTVTGAMVVSAVLLALAGGAFAMLANGLQYSDSQTGVPVRAQLESAAVVLGPPLLVVVTAVLAKSSGRPGWTGLAGLATPVLLIGLPLLAIAVAG